MLMQDRTLQALMLIGAVVLVLLWNTGVWELVVMWIMILFGLLVAYTALKAMESAGPMSARAQNLHEESQNRSTQEKRGSGAGDPYCARVETLLASFSLFALFPFLFSFLLSHWLFLRTFHTQLVHAILRSC
jgi:hypothetical protein